jgi:hypothetical protein
LWLVVDDVHELGGEARGQLELLIMRAPPQADGIDLPSDLLDRIDQIVPPGVTINVADNMWNISTPALSTAFRRR